MTRYLDGTTQQGNENCFQVKRSLIAHSMGNDQNLDCCARMTDLANSAKLVFFLVACPLDKAALQTGMTEAAVPIAFANVKNAF